MGLSLNTKKVAANELTDFSTSVEINQFTNFSTSVNAATYPTRIWTEIALNSSKATVYYATDGRSGRVYRGYLTRQGGINIGGTRLYVGYLYRSDLPYPIPSKLAPLPTSELTGDDTIEKGHKK